jgi:hypothetical protein
LLFANNLAIGTLQFDAAARMVQDILDGENEQ